MLPAAQKPHEVRRTHRFNLAPQPSQRLPVNPRQNAPMTKLMIPAREIPAQNLTFAFELRQRNLDIAQRQTQPLRQLRRRERTNRIRPSTSRSPTHHRRDPAAR